MRILAYLYIVLNNDFSAIYRLKMPIKPRFKEKKEKIYMKTNEVARRQYSDNGQSEFSHRWACWANNHNGWSKMKKLNRKLFKKKFRRETKKDIDENVLY